MDFINLFDFSSSFHAKDELLDLIKKSDKYGGENICNAQLINFFKTSKQRSYLVVSDKFIYCILDNSKKEGLQLRWVQSVNDFTDNDNAKGKVVTIEDTPPKENTGLVHFGFHSNWYYTKNLFKEKSIQDTLKEAIKVVKNSNIT